MSPPFGGPWPRGTDELRVRLIHHHRAARRDRGTELPRMVLDTDTYNEIDDQFALVHALLSPHRVQLEAIYAAVRRDAIFGDLFHQLAEHAGAQGR